VQINFQLGDKMIKVIDGKQPTIKKKKPIRTLIIILFLIAWAVIVIQTYVITSYQAPSETNIDTHTP